MNSYPKTIAITGGIGSGKSEVINILKDLGEKVISCDEITLSLYEKKEIMTILAKMFPTCYDANLDKMDKSKISKLVFSNKDKLQELTDFLTPLILEECLKQAKAFDGRVFIEVPLLFERGAQDRFDQVIVVMRNIKDRISSVMARNNLSKADALSRISSQFDYKNADLSKFIILQNNLSLEHLKTEVQRLIKTL